MEFIIIAAIVWAIVSALTKNRKASAKNAQEQAMHGDEQSRKLAATRAVAERMAAQSYADQDRSPQVYAAQMRSQQAAHPADRAGATYPRQSPPPQSYAPMSRAASEQEAIWGTPARSPEGGTADGDPFCQGPAGRFASSEGVGDSEGQGFEGASAPGGEGYSAPGMLGTRSAFSVPQRNAVRTKGGTYDATEEHQTEAAPRIELSFDREAAIRGLLYAEVLGKPKALRR